MSSASKVATELAKLQPSNASEIKTPQELIHIRHKVSLLQYKYWILMLRTYRELYEEGERFGSGDFCYLSMAGVADAIGYQPKTKELEEDLEKIRQEPIFFNVLEKDGDKAKRGQGFISEWHVSNNRIGVVFPPVLRNAVENLDRKDSIFHLLNWDIFNSFSGKYEAILYKLCKDYVGVGQTKWLTVEQFRDYMGILPSEYPDFKRLNQWCISGPIKRINESELSDIVVSVKFKRENRRVVEMQFSMSLKRQTVLDFGDDPAFRFAKVKIAPAQQRRFLSGRDPKMVELAIIRANEYAEGLEKKGQNVEDLHGIYATAIAKDWGSEYESKLAAKAAKEEEKKRKAEAAARKKGTEALRSEFVKARKERAEAILGSMGKDGLSALYEEWKSEGERAAMLLKQGVKGAVFKSWARERVMTVPVEVDFENWLKERAA